MISQIQGKYIIFKYYKMTRNKTKNNCLTFKHLKNYTWILYSTCYFKKKSFRHQTRYYSNIKITFNSTENNLERSSYEIQPELLT